MGLDPSVVDTEALTPYTAAEAHTYVSRMHDLFTGREPWPDTPPSRPSWWRRRPPASPPLPTPDLWFRLRPPTRRARARAWLRARWRRA